MSDFHVGKDDYAQRQMFDYIVKHVIQRRDEGFVPDFVWITGDLANRGRDPEFVQFWLEFVGPLHRAIGSDIANRTFVVPGNHDVDRDLHPAFSREEMSAAESRHFDPTEQGCSLRAILIPRFRAFLETDLSPARRVFANAAGAYSTVLEIRGAKVGIVGVNTAWLSKDDHDERKLTPGKPLLERALELIADTQLRVVLGHHPINWFLPAEQKAIKSLLGKFSALYLHGHLHEAWAEPEFGGGYQFLTVQSGAAFQAREGEKWRNGLVWGEVEFETQEVRLQPRSWTPEQQAWTLAAEVFPEVFRKGDWWIYPLPGSERAKKAPKSGPPKASPPRGWSVVAPSDLQKHLVGLDEETAIRFFNGAIPGWKTALSTTIPRRQVVRQLSENFREASTSAQPIVTLLLAAACEGKSTALLQAAFEVVRSGPEWRILWRADDEASLRPPELLAVMNEQSRWLVVADEADRIAQDLLLLVRQLPEGLHGRVHFLIACRDSDWQASGAHELTWPNACAFRKERLTGLALEDAAAIVATWTRFGTQGLGELAKIAEEERVGALASQAHEEAKVAHGAFFGALLAVRHGSDLQNHARRMLERLGQLAPGSGPTLRDALGFIAAMHAEGLEFLSRPVLAEALGRPPQRLQREVIYPLGQEAAATTSSSLVFTRHRRIAKAVVSVLESDFAEDVGQKYVALGESAIRAAARGEPVIGLANWRYALAGHFADTERIELALRIARGVLDQEPENTMTLLRVAQLYRKANMPEGARRLFLDVHASSMRDRAFFFEWSVAEGECGDHVASLLLAAYSVSDKCPSTRIDNNRAKLSLAGLGVAFGNLFSAFHEAAFRDAQAAVAVLGLRLQIEKKTEGYFRNHLLEAVANGANEPTADEAFGALQKGVHAAQGLGVNPIVSDSGSMTFNGLQLLVRAATATQRRRA